MTAKAAPGDAVFLRVVPTVLVVEGAAGAEGSVSSRVAGAVGSTGTALGF